jgi:fumarate reductase subunit C
MSNRFKPAAKTYVRPMTGWWKHNPYFVRYMIREGSAVFITLYALILLVGLLCLSIGPAAYNAWLSAMTSPLLILFHLAAFVMVCYHSYTWFKVMPKTMPDLPIDPGMVPVYSLAFMVCISVASLAIVEWLVR